MIELDRIDAKIIEIMIKDARSSLREIAEATGVTSNSIFKRLEKLKLKGVIVGSTVLFNPNKMEKVSAINVELKVDQSEIENVVNILREKQNVLVCLEGIGRCNVYVLLCLYQINHLDALIDEIRILPGVLNITVSGKVYETEFLTQNVDL